jgi:hypothetical protein
MSEGLTGLTGSAGGAIAELITREGGYPQGAHAPSRMGHRPILFKSAPTLPEKQIARHTVATRALLMWGKGRNARVSLKTTPRQYAAPSCFIMQLVTPTHAVQLCA